METTTPLIQVFLLSYNRPDYLLVMVESLLAMTYTNFEIIISDNSNNDRVEESVNAFLQKHSQLQNIRYLRRRPSVPALEHFNLILSEITADYFCMLHDDDVVAPPYLASLIQALLHYPDASAIGCNAWILQGEEKTLKLFNPRLAQGRKIMDSHLLALSYLNSSVGHVPFPTYLYRTAKVKNLQLREAEGGKHADVSFLLKVAKQGPIIWEPKPLFWYRRHSSNDSISVDLKAVFKLSRFIKQNNNVSAEALKEYRVKHIFLWLKQSHQGKRLHTKALRQILVKYLLLNPRVIFQSLVRRIRNLFRPS
jgi:glycosyltransferase involved in cell wall biosynthesis